MKKQTSIRFIITTLIVPARAGSFLLVLAFFSLIARAQHPAMLMRLVADGNQMQNETVVYFDSAATFNYDPQYDAPSLGVNDGFLNIVTRLSNIDYQVNAVPTISQNMIIPVKITTGTSGTYSVYANNLQNLPEGASVQLHDTYNNSNFDLRSGVAQYFISDSETVARFQLIISVNMIHNVSATSINPTCTSSANGAIHALATGAGPFNYYWKDSLNNIIRTALNKGTADTLPGANAGTYRIDVTTPGTNNNATVYLNLQSTMSANANFHAQSNTLNMYNGVASAHFTNTSLNAQSYLWDFGDGTGSLMSNPTHTYNQVGTYTVTLKASNTACSDVSVHKEILTINATMGIEVQQQPALVLGADGQGYYINATATQGTLSVTDLLGRKVVSDVPLNGAQRIYLDPSLPAHEAFIILLIGADHYDSVKFIKVQ